MAYIRKTKDEWQIWGDYGSGLEELSAATTPKEARDTLADYRKNAGYGGGQSVTRLELRKKRVPLDA